MNNIVDKKILLITHKADIDGIGCAVLFHKCYPTAHIVFVDAGEAVDDMLLKQIDLFDKVWITDVSPSKKCLDKLRERYTGEKLAMKLSLVDHHATAMWLNDYLWAYVATDNGSACKLLYDILSIDNQLEDMRLFAELVSDQDTYKHQMVGSHDMAKLLRCMGLQPMFERLCADSKCKVGVGLLMTPGEKLLLKCDDYKFAEYYAQVIERVSTVKMGDHMVACLFAERYISEIGHRLLEEDNELEAVMIVNMTHGHISLRSNGGFNCAQYAKMNGGGGHAKAAGFTIDTYDMMADMWGIGE